MSRSSQLCATAMVALILAIQLMLVQPVAAQTLLVGDVNGDGVVNVVDVQLTVNIALGVNTDPAMKSRADVNGDGVVNVLDVQRVVSIALNGNGLTITLPTANAVPLSPLNIATIGLAHGSPVLVTFSDPSAGFSAQSTAFRVDPDGSVWVGVPIYINPQIGVTSGNVQVTVSQGAKSSRPQPLGIQDLPTLARLGTSLGQLSQGFFGFATQILANQIGELDELSVLLQNSGQSLDVSSVRNSLLSLQQKLIAVRMEIDTIMQNPTVVIPEGTTASGVPLQANAAYVEAMDRLIGAWALQEFPSGVATVTALSRKQSPGLPTDLLRRVSWPAILVATTACGPTNTSGENFGSSLDMVNAAFDYANAATDPNGSSAKLSLAVGAAIASVAPVISKSFSELDPAVITSINRGSKMLGYSVASIGLGLSLYNAVTDKRQEVNDLKTTGRVTPQHYANTAADKSEILNSVGVFIITGLKQIPYISGTTAAADTAIAEAGGVASAAPALFFYPPIIAGAGLTAIAAMDLYIKFVEYKTNQTENLLLIQRLSPPYTQIHPSGGAVVTGRVNSAHAHTSPVTDSTSLCCFGPGNLPITGKTDGSGNYSIPVPLGMQNTNYHAINITISDPITGGSLGSGSVDLSGLNVGSPVISCTPGPAIALTPPPQSCDQCYFAEATCSEQCLSLGLGHIASCQNQCAIVRKQCLATCP